MLPFLMVILKSTPMSFLKCEWQSQWDEAVDDTLHEIHPQLGLWPGGSRIIRREESVLARIQIGHTH